MGRAKPSVHCIPSDDDRVVSMRELPDFRIGDPRSASTTSWPINPADFDDMPGIVLVD